MSETTNTCTRGCTIKNRHLADCADRDDCRGCMPRTAEHGRLCWPCHRRLELRLTDADTLDRWLTGNLASGQGVVPEDVRVSSSGDGDPAPIKVHVYDARQELRDHWATWVDWLEERHGLTTVRSTVAGDARRLLSWIDRIEEWEQIDDLLEHTDWLFAQAHKLAPWRPGLRRVGSIPCPDCGEVSLVIYGGETDISCQSCSGMIREEHFGIWEQIVHETHGIEAAG